MSLLRLAFMGTPDFAVPSLRALAAEGHEIAAVYTQPPRPAGRGQQAKPSPVHALADAHGWPVRTPAGLKDAAAQRAFADLNLDVAVVVAYGLLLPAPVLTASRLGCLNVHASLLPRWRGAAPIQRAILAGDAQTGISIMQMDEGLDTGPILAQQAIAIAATETASTLHDRLAALGAEMIVAAVAGRAAGTLHPRPQPVEGVTYAEKLSRAEAWLDWRRPAADLERQVRAFAPWPGVTFQAQGETIKVLAAEVIAGEGVGAAPGTILDDRLSVACGSGALRPTRLQRGGRAACDTAAFLRGFPISPGTHLPVPA
jgi:methionyl-tRNA formyltransferase